MKNNDHCQPGLEGPDPVNTPLFQVSVLQYTPPSTWSAFPTSLTMN